MNIRVPIGLYFSRLYSLKILSDRNEEQTRARPETNDVSVTLGELRLFAQINTDQNAIKGAAETVRENLREFKDLPDDEIIILDRKKKTFTAIRKNVKSAATMTGLAVALGSTQNEFLAEIIKGISSQADDVAYYATQFWPVDLSLDEESAASDNRRVIVATRPDTNVTKLVKTLGASDGIAAGIQDIVRDGQVTFSGVFGLCIESFMFLREKVVKKAVQLADGSCSAVD
jgi:hypothetical protein